MSRGTPDPARCLLVSLTRLSLSLAGFPKTVLLPYNSLIAVHYPTALLPWFRLFPFRSPLLRKSKYFLSQENVFSFFSSGYLDVSVPRVPSVYL